MWKDFPENSLLCLSDHIVKKCMFRCNQSKVKGKLRDEEYTYSPVFLLPLEGFSSIYTLAFHPHSLKAT
jgi:hypothetical protein